MRNPKKYAVFAVAAAAAFVIPATSSTAGEAQADHSRNDEAVVAALDTQYQAAVKRNDAETVDRILADDMVLVTGRGTVIPKSGFVQDARNKTCLWEHQEEVVDPATDKFSQTVRLVGRDTAVVSAELWEKGTCKNDDGTTSSLDAHLWFSDTYVRSYGRWHYAFGQSSIKLPQP